MSRTRLNLIIVGILLSLFLSSVEGTVVATAMPTIVAQLGGLAIYSWVFSIYMLTSTTTVPIYGKLADLYGCKRVYAFSMALFLIGSALCGTATSMEQLVFYRAVQGLGAGGVLPMAFTIIGQLFTLEQRTRLQGLFSGVWGISAVIGPLVGGFLVDQVSWHWVFLINLVPGVIAIGLVWFVWQDLERPHARGVSIDIAGAAFLTLGVLVLLLGLNELGTPLGWIAMAVAGAFFVALVWAERRAVDPILPLPLFRDRLFVVSILHGVLSGWAMFGSVNYIPLFVQAVLGTSATEAGITLMPMSLFWTLASILGTRLLMKVGYRSLSLFGMVLLTIGALLMSFIGSHASQVLIMLYVSLMGIGMGLSIPAFLIAVQSSVPKHEMGVATSTLQFSRSIGGTLGVSVLGAALSTRLNAELIIAGVDPASVSLSALLNSLQGTEAALTGPVRGALAVSIASLFLIAFGAAVAGLLATAFAPSGTVSQIVPRGSDRTVEDG
jgi:EmrB/QacA subfamily drug resistance transporter